MIAPTTKPRQVPWYSPRLIRPDSPWARLGSLADRAVWIPAWEGGGDRTAIIGPWGRYDADVGSGATWDREHWGVGLNSKATSSRIIKTSIVDYLRPRHFVVVMWAGILNSNGVNQFTTRLVAVTANAGDNSPFQAYGLDRHASAEEDLRVDYSTDGSTLETSVFSGATPTSEYGEFHTYVVGIDCREEYAVLYKDGVFFGEGQGTPNSANEFHYDATAALLINGHVFDEDQHPDADFAIAGIIPGLSGRRPIVRAVAEAFHADPFGALRMRTHATETVEFEPTGEVDFINLTRASVARQLGADFLYDEVAPNVLREKHHVLANDGEWYRTMLLEDEATPTLKWSADFSNAVWEWTDDAQMSRQDAVSMYDGETASLWTIDGNSRRFAQNNVGNLSSGPETLFVDAERAPGQQWTDIVLYDSDAADRVAFVRFDWNALTTSLEFSGAGTAVTHGSFPIGPGPNGGPARRIWLTATPTNPGNARRIRVYPTGAPTNSDSGYIHLVDHVEGPVPSSGIVTGATPSADIREADDASSDFTAAPQEITGYVELIDLGNVLEQTESGVFFIGSFDGLTDPNLNLGINSVGNARLLHENGTASDAQINSPDFGFLDRVEFVCELHADGSVTLRQWINDGAEATDSDPTAPGLAGSWADTKIWINQRGQVSTSRGFSGIVKIVFLEGTKTRAQLRAAGPEDADVLFFYVPPGPTVEGYRFRNDDGDEAAATWAQAQDVDHAIDVDDNIRLRALLDEFPGGQVTIQSAPDGTEDWSDVTE